MPNMTLNQLFKQNREDEERLRADEWINQHGCLDCSAGHMCPELSLRVLKLMTPKQPLPADSDGDVNDASNDGT